MVTEIPKIIFNPPLIFMSPDEVQMQKVNRSKKINKQKNTDPVTTRYWAITGTVTQ